MIEDKSDWGVYQTPGPFERMQKAACTQMESVHLVDGAGHWLQQKQPEALAQFLRNRLAQPTSVRGQPGRMRKPSSGRSGTTLLRLQIQVDGLSATAELISGRQTPWKRRCVEMIPGRCAPSFG